MRHERQLLIPGWDQDALTSASATLVGAGAIGSALAVSLVRLGFLRLTIIDPDTLELHNLANQLYTHADLGRRKVEALVQHLRAIEPQVQVTPVAAPFQDVPIPSGPPLLFGCLDAVAPRVELNWLATEKRLTYIDGGIANLAGQVQTHVPGQSACLQCWPVLPTQAARGGCSSDPIPSTYVTAALCANLMALQAVKLLQGRTWRSYVSFDLERGTLQNLTLEPNPRCEACGGT